MSVLPCSWQRFLPAAWEHDERSPYMRTSSRCSLMTASTSHRSGLSPCADRSPTPTACRLAPCS